MSGAHAAESPADSPLDPSQLRFVTRGVTPQSGGGAPTGSGAPTGNGQASGSGAHTGNGENNNARMRRAPPNPPQGDAHTESRTVTRGNPPPTPPVQNVPKAPQVVVPQPHVNAAPAVVNNPQRAGGGNGNGQNAHENKGNEERGRGRDDKNDKNDKNDQKR